MFKPKEHPHLPQIFDYHAFKTRELDALGMTQTLVPDAVRNFSHGFFANRQRHAVPFHWGMMELSVKNKTATQVNHEVCPDTPSPGSHRNYSLKFIAIGRNNHTTAFTDITPFRLAEARRNHARPHIRPGVRH